MVNDDVCATGRWSGRSVALFLSVMVVAVLRLHLPAYNASNLAVVPDSVEYTVSAERLARLGRWDVEIDGHSYPPGIAPGFSVLVLAPFFAVAGAELGNAIYVELAAALLAIAAVFALARRLAGPRNGDWAGLLASLALLVHPTFEHWSREIMTDIPGLALGLLVLALHAAEPDRPTLRRSLVVGALIAVAFALRMVYLSLLAPFLLSVMRLRDRRWGHLAALAAPPIAMAAAQCAYNAATFGDPLRTGYHYWHSVPYDYDELVFSNAYLQPNLAAFAAPSAWIPLAALCLAARSLARAPQTRRALAAALLAAAPISLFHLRYYYVDERFHLLLIATAMTLAAVALVRFASRLLPERSAWAGLALSALAAFWPAPPRNPLPGRRSTADALARLTPSNAWIISAIDPVFLEPLVLRGSKRHIIPATRGVAFASQVVAPRRVRQPWPRPKNAWDRRCKGLLDAGCIDPVRFTARETPEAIVQLVRSGEPVFVDLTLEHVTGAYASLQSAGLRGEPVDGKKWLVRLR